MCYWTVFVSCIYVFIVLFLLYFFFFKQKTAYEMRISDWSSDVCSSDLARPLARPERRARPRLAAAGQPTALVADAAREREAHRAPQAEIGRASCRERVCPYV